MTKRVKVGQLYIGGGNPVAIQSMCNTKTTDTGATISQILALEKAGVEMVRVAVPDLASAKAITAIKAGIHVPLVADIHFDYKLAIASCDSGADKIRINPGNIGGVDKVAYLADYLRERRVPIRIGVNSGSIPSDLYEQYGNTATALVESALRQIKVLEDCAFEDIVISVKASSVSTTIAAYRMLSCLTEYPLHLGVTEAGFGDAAVVKSALGIGTLLADGIGDTIRVSITGDPVREVTVAQEILRAAGLRTFGVEVVSCPTCARTSIDIEGIAKKVQEATSDIVTPVKVAVMGCVVNGLGEGKDADVGVAGGENKSILMSHGEKIGTVDNNLIVEKLVALIREFAEANNG